MADKTEKKLIGVHDPRKNKKLILDPILPKLPN
jgi:hypothetical protein